MKISSAHLVTRVLHQHRSFFHASPRCADLSRSATHYERLNIRHDASPSEIKKSFYSLSKSHHPDVNRSDPNAALTFSLLSESYTILSDPVRRAQYDEQVLELRSQPRPRGSYHSAGRAASGLSRRRPPPVRTTPSFHRSTRQQQQQHQQQQQPKEATGPSSSPWGGMGPGDNPFRADDPVAHFDQGRHRRTHEREDERRWHRRAMGDDDVEFEPQTSMAGHFFIVAAILAATFVAPLLYLQFMRLGRRDKVKERD